MPQVLLRARPPASGVRSSWNGHSPTRSLPWRRSSTPANSTSRCKRDLLLQPLDDLLRDPRHRALRKSSSVAIPDDILCHTHTNMATRAGHAWLVRSRTSAQNGGGTTTTQATPCPSQTASSNYEPKPASPRPTLAQRAAAPATPAKSAAMSTAASPPASTRSSTSPKRSTSPSTTSSSTTSPAAHCTSPTTASPNASPQLSELDEDDRQSLLRVLDAFLTRKRLHALASDTH